ncbi:MAG: glycoside hydrolase family 31 protein, partial [Planctomycetota bacterium]|nr:glycoside hydrolase family 31 protein [Planctomycetota bacterium]
MSDLMNRPVRCSLCEFWRRKRVSRSLRAGFWLGLGLFLGGLAGKCGAAEAGKAPGWADTAPLTKQNVVLALDGGGLVRVDVLADRLFRIRYSKTGKWTESALNRYGVLTASFAGAAFEKAEANGVHTLATKQAKLAIRGSDGAITLADAAGKPLTEQAAPQYQAGGGYDVRFALSDKERLYGLGDVSRENLMRRGGAYEFWVLNVKAYIPIPVVLSSRGWGLLMNTTWRNTIDIGKSDPQRMICTARRSDLDYYLFCGPDYRSLLDTYTSFSGRPALLPIWGYAFTYVCNQNIDAFNLLNEALTFRRERMPCDVLGLEPGWMSKNYDGSTDKTWHPQRFPIPSWAPKGPHTFLGALKRKGFKLSLWLCCDYDLGVYEEQLLSGRAPAGATPA